MILETDKDLALGSDVGRQWESIPKSGTAEDCYRGEQALINVRIYSVEAGILVFEV